MKDTKSVRNGDSQSVLQVYLINLRRRPDRRERMLWSLYELEISAKVVDAVDGASVLHLHL